MKIKNYLYIFIGLILILFIFWNRLIRIRLPKELPLELSTSIFFIYVGLILTCVYIIYTTIKSKNKQLLGINFYYPLEVLYEYLRSYTKIRIYLDKILAYCLTVFVIKEIKSALFYVFLIVLPRIIPPIILIIDCFINHEIVLFYKTLPLLLLPLIYKYLSYAYNNHYLYHSNILDDRIFIYMKDPRDDLLLASEYIENLFDAKVNNTKFSCTFELQETSVRDTCKKANIHVLYFDREKALDYFKTVLNNLYINYLFVLNLQEQKLNYDKKLILIVTTLYLICWCYILVISFHSLDQEDLQDFLQTLGSSFSNPFID